MKYQMPEPAMKLHAKRGKQMSPEAMDWFTPDQIQAAYEAGRVAGLEETADRIEALQAEVESLQSTPFSEEAYEILQGKNKALQSRITALESDKEVLLGHMDTINRCSNDPAIYNLSKVVIERFTLGAAPQQAEPVNAQLLNALKKLQKHDFELRSKTGEGFAPYVVKIIDSAVDMAQQAEPKEQP